MPEPGSERDGIPQMQDGIRDWVRRTARHGGPGLRAASPTVLLSLLCASAVSPVIAASSAGFDGAALAGIGLVSSVGGNVLSTVISDAVNRMRARGKPRPSAEDLEKGIAGQIQNALSAGGGEAQTLRAGIAEVLKAANASEIALQEAIEAGDTQIRCDIIAVFGELSDNFEELWFLLDSIERAAAKIQENQDEHSVQLRLLMDMVGRAAAESRLAREMGASRARPGGEGADGRTGEAPKWTGGCPYRGLLPFTETEAEVFYGRERMVADLTGRLSRLPSQARIAVVTGASGAGKSSLLRAGLVPALARGFLLPGSQDWPCVVMTPTGDPVAELAAHLAALAGYSATPVLDGLSADPGNARRAVRQALVANARRTGKQPDISGPARLVLIVDQFEQIFTPDAGQSGESGRQAFITALCAAATQPAGPQGEPPALVILAVRGDYWDQCATYPQLARALQDSSFVVGPMTETERRLAITGPAGAAGLRIEDTLTEVILGDLNSAGSAASQGILPLLSQAMLVTWENRDGNELTVHGYGQAGGITRAVETSADAVYDTLPAGRQTQAREILVRMTAVGSDGRITRRTVSRDDLYAAQPGAGRDQIDAILEAFAAKRLVVLGDGTAEISHDALLHAWPRFRSWLEEDQASLILHSQLAEDAETWRLHGEDPSFLYRGTQLAAVRQGAARWSADPGRYPAVTSTERNFLDASDRAASRASRQRRIFSTVLVLLVIASLAGAGVAVNAARVAREQAALAVSSQLAAKSEALDGTDPFTASRLAAASWRLDQDNPLARESLLDVNAQPARGVLNIHSSAAFDVAFSPDGKLLATAGGDNTIRLWNTVTRSQTGSPIAVPNISGVGVFGVAFSRGGQLLATAGSDGMVRLWNSVTRRQVGPPIAVPGSSTGGVGGVAFSPGGQLLATAGGDNMVRLWDLTTRRQIGRPIAVPSSGGVFGVAFSPDGKLLATTGGNGTVLLWNIAVYNQVGSAITVPGSSADGVGGVAFSRGGQLLAAVGGDNTVRLWNSVTRRQVGPPIVVPGSSTDGLLGVAISSDGEFLATAGGDNTVRLWDTVTRRQVGPPIAVPGGDGVFGVAISFPGKLLATADGDGTVRVWDLATRRQIGPPIAVPSSRGRGVSGVAFSPDGEFLAAAGGDNTVRLWDLATRHQVGATITVPGGGVSGVAFSPDGRLLATAGGDNTVRLWDLATRRQIGPPIAVPSNINFVSGVAFGSNGKLLATAGGDGAVRVWNVAFPGNLLNAACAIAGRSLTHQQWSVYAPSEPFQKVCP